MDPWIDPIASWLGAWSSGLTVQAVLFRIMCSVLLSAIIGCERASKRHSAGLRTFMLVSLATTTAAILDAYLALAGGGKIYLLSAASVVAVAIISVNSMLFSSRNQIKGLTTAFGLWTCAMIGLALGAGYYAVTVAAYLVEFTSLSLCPAIETYLKDRSNQFEIHLELTSSQYLQSFVTTIRRLGLKIDDIEQNPAYANSGLSVYSVAISIISKELKQYKTHAEIIEALRTLEYIYHIEEMHQ